MTGSNEDDDAKTHQLKAYWAGEGRAKWATNPHPWTTLNKLLARYVKNARVRNGLTTNIFTLAGQPMPNSRTGRLAALKPEHRAALRRAIKGE